MNSKPPPGCKRVRDWKGLRVRLTRSVSNGYATYPAGLTGVVTSAVPGLRLRGDACKCCGVEMHISRVPTDAVEVIRG